MLLTNIILVVIVLGFIGAGFKDGFIETLGRFVGAVLGFLAARAWSLKISALLAAFMPTGWAQLIAFLLIFFIATRLIGWGFKLLNGAFRILSILPFLTSINSFLGAALGGIEGVILVGGLIYLVTTFTLIPWLASLFASSMIAALIMRVFTILLGVLL